MGLDSSTGQRRTRLKRLSRSAVFGCSDIGFIVGPMIPCFVRGVSANAKLGPQPVFVNGNHIAAKRRKRPKVLTAENAENAKKNSRATDGHR